MISFPNAKINFGLYITGVRIDGYHNIESILWPVPWKDILEIIPAPDQRFSFRQTGIKIGGESDENLVVRAWELMKDKYDLPAVHIHLHKIIPMGAGLGGGSSDAAHTIMLLNNLFDLKLNVRSMQRYASRLGSDCPFFIDGKPHFVAGTGTLLAQTQANLSGMHIGIVKPEAHISTAEAYANISPAPAPSGWEKPSDDPSCWKKEVRNQFEDYVLEAGAEIGQLKEKLYHLGAVYASLSGSGSAVYGLFQEAPDMKSWFPEEYCWQGQL